MCSIYGFVGRNPDFDIFDGIRNSARDRGRDGGEVEVYDFNNGVVAALGNWRATPTTEPTDVEYQPYGGVVHNGTISNDRELGNREGDVDSKVLPKVLDRRTLPQFAESLNRLKGSYALAATVPGMKTVYVAVNYKPLHYVRIRETTYFSSMERHFDGVLPFGHRACEVPPYTAMDLRSGLSIPLRQKPRTHRTLVVCSAGLDSTAAATLHKRRGDEVCLLHFLYGCHAERREAMLIPKIAEYLGCSYRILTIDPDIVAGSALTTTEGGIAGGVEGAEYAHEWVPARNLMMVSFAAAYAEAQGYNIISLGANLEEAGAYPDNEEQMYILLNRVLDNAVQNGYKLRIELPFGSYMKHEIVKKGVQMNAPFHLTWSCYKGGDKHCGECGPCYMRKTAFARNGLVDPVFA